MSRRNQDEPFPDPDELVQFGDDPVLPEGFTSGGAPFGTTLSEFRETTEELESERGWVRAKRAIRSVLRDRGILDPDIGRVRRIGGGLARDAYVADVSGLWPNQVSTLVVALVPHVRHLDKGEDRQARILHEARLLAWLAERELPFRVPRIVGVAGEGHSHVSVMECMDGVPVDLRARKMPGGRPWEVVAPIAAGVHGLDVAGLEWLGGSRTCREHGEEVVAGFAHLEGAEESEVRSALAWTAEHLPPDEPAVLLHGDLLGQNILVGRDERPAVIDWELARLGDPAYDLAIVTRGVRRPFQVSGGLERLLEEYNRRASRQLEPGDVLFHEICLHLEWYRMVAAGEENAPPMDQVLPRLRRLVHAGR